MFKLSYRYPAGCGVLLTGVYVQCSDSSAVAASRQLLVITVTWTRTQVQNTNCDNTVKSDLVTYLLICCQKKSGPLNFQIDCLDPAEKDLNNYQSLSKSWVSYKESPVNSEFY